MRIEIRVLLASIKSRFPLSTLLTCRVTVIMTCFSAYLNLPTMLLNLVSSSDLRLHTT